MKPSLAGTARELEPPAPARGEQRAAESEGRCRSVSASPFSRQRQELLVRGALRGAGVSGAAAVRSGELPGEAAQRSRLEEKFLEENILLLRKQLVGLGRRWGRGCP